MLGIELILGLFVICGSVHAGSFSFTGSVGNQANHQDRNSDSQIIWNEQTAHGSDFQNSHQVRNVPCIPVNITDSMGKKYTDCWNSIYYSRWMQNFFHRQGLSFLYPWFMSELGLADEVNKENPFKPLETHHTIRFPNSCNHRDPRPTSRLSTSSHRPVRLWQPTPVTYHPVFLPFSTRPPRYFPSTTPQPVRFPFTTPSRRVHFPNWKVTSSLPPTEISNRFRFPGPSRTSSSTLYPQVTAATAVHERTERTTVAKPYAVSSEMDATSVPNETSTDLETHATHSTANDFSDYYSGNSNTPVITENTPQETTTDRPFLSWLNDEIIN